MKRLEEILKRAWSKDKENEPLDEKYIGETTAIYAAMKQYAREVAQASLEKAAENANVLVEGTLTEERKTLFTLFDKGIKGVVERKVTVDIESITNEQNITLL